MNFTNRTIVFFCKFFEHLKSWFLGRLMDTEEDVVYNETAAYNNLYAALDARDKSRKTIKALDNARREYYTTLTRVRADANRLSWITDKEL
jgi:aspartyl/asparaginyl beta-hydroxylase (cupin superfamily)